MASNSKYRRVKRDYSRPFFRRQTNYVRWVFIAIMAALIVTIPVVAFWQQDRIQYAALESVGLAPTATPFASERAERGEEFYISGDIESAAVHFEMAVTQQPDNINYLYEYGLLLIEQDENDEAVRVGERIIELVPQDPRGYALKANALAWTEPAEAIPVAVTGIEESSRQFAPLHGALAIAYTQIGRYQQALQQGDLAVRIDPMDASARRSYSFPLILTGDYNGAIGQLEQAIAINPNITAPYFELASLYRLINRENYGTAYYEEVLRMDPDNAKAYLRLCQTYNSVGEFLLAEDYCQRALELDPNEAEAHRTIGQLRYSRRNYEGAIESFRTCLTLVQGGDPSTLPQSVDVMVDISQLAVDEVEIECLYILGLAHYALDHCDAAWGYLSTALEHPAAQSTTLEAIRDGLFLVTDRCAGYRGQQLPTPIPPTAIPPTPIGGF